MEIFEEDNSYPGIEEVKIALSREALFWVSVPQNRGSWEEAIGIRRECRWFATMYMTWQLLGRTKECRSSEYFIWK